MTALNPPHVEALLRQIESGDDAARGVVVCVHDEHLRWIIQIRLDRRVAQRVDVEDVLQETHVEAVKRLAEYLAARDVSLLIWLRFLAVQRCITQARRHLAAGMRDARREQPMAAAAPLDASSAALEDVLSAHLTTPSYAAARGEARATVQQAMTALEPFDREILCLRHFEELDNREAASVLGIAPSAASKRYVRALVRLRDVLDTLGIEHHTFGNSQRRRAEP